MKYYSLTITAAILSCILCSGQGNITKWKDLNYADDDKYFQMMTDFFLKEASKK